VAANLPYNVASPILFRLADLYDRGLRFSDATLMLQREVADRLLADPGTKDYGVLTVLIRHQASVERMLALPPGAFRPPPKVQSALVRLRFHAPDPMPRDASLFASLVKAAFTQRRKTIANAIAGFGGADRIGASDALSRAGIAPARRPETLTVEEWVKLADAYAGA
jgi:16S rRNA (adenine1518-N6/adenine1519-N6)-dimethyltransferase